MKPETEKWIRDVTELLNDMVTDAGRVKPETGMSWFLSYSGSARRELISMPHNLLMKLSESLRMAIWKLRSNEKTDR